MGLGNTQTADQSTGPPKGKIRFCRVEPVNLDWTTPFECWLSTKHKRAANATLIITSGADRILFGAYPSSPSAVLRTNASDQLLVRFWF